MFATGETCNDLGGDYFQRRDAVRAKHPVANSNNSATRSSFNRSLERGHIPIRRQDPADGQHHL
jgi:hypothetical protein